MKGPLVLGGRFLVGVDAHGSLAGLAGIVQRLGGLPSGRDLGEVPGELGDMRSRTSAVQALDRLTDPPVQLYTERDPQPFIYHLPHEGMRKATPADGARFLGHDAQRYRLRQGAEHVLDRQLASGGNQRQVELPAHHRGGR